MLPAVLMGFGNQIYYTKGSRIIPCNLTLVSTATQSYNGGAMYASNPDNTLEGHFFGGLNTWWPESYANHKVAAFYKNKLYFTANSLAGAVGTFYICTFDGSGIFTQPGSAYSTNKWRGGRGVQFLTPSGTTSIDTDDAGLLVYNGNLFIVANNFSSAAADFTAWRSLGWHTHAPVAGSRGDRTFRVFSIDKNDKKIAGPAYSFAPDADNKNDNHICDIIGFHGDLYFGTWSDIYRVHGCSGSIEQVASTPTQKAAKCFAVFPNAGYSNGVSVHGDGLFCLSGSGVLTHIAPSGSRKVRTVVDLGWINEDVRDGAESVRYGSLTRIEDATSEPGRSSLLLNFNNELHAFVATETSGYRHFYCGGNPSGTTNWHETTDDMPKSFRYWDGNMFGFVDDYHNKMVVAHISQSEIGLFGYAGGQKGAGGISIYEYDVNRDWHEIYNGSVGLSPRGLVPYNNIGPDILIPSGSNPVFYKCSDYAIVQYTLYDYFRRNCNIDIEYSIDNCLTWHTARRFRDYSGNLAGSGISNLSTSPEGINYDFYWDYINDVSFNTEKDCYVRITPKLVR